VRDENVCRSRRLDGARSRFALKAALRAAGAAFSYFTILPTGRFAREGPPGAGALSMLPIVGAVVGVGAGLAGWAASAWLHAPWAFVVAWAVTVVLSGAVHLDGFLDSCDALFAAVPPQRRREILNDPRHGSFAIAGMAIVTAFWLAALAGIAPVRYPLVLAFTGAAARLAVVPLAWIFPYGTQGSMAQAFARRPPPIVFAVLFAIVEIVAWFVAPLAIVILPIIIAIDVAVVAWARGRLDGAIGGDVYGAAIVAGEVTMLVTLSVLR
jgi:adenosylcobinamide-GDP ribazoletransferase